jgi:hypothetical protein
MRSPNLLFFVLCFVSSASMACMPLRAEFWKETESRVKSNFDGAQFVVVAEVMDVRKVPVTIGPGDFKVVAERASFRVERAFKGHLKRGDTFNVDSGITSCGRGVMDASFIPFIPGAKAPPTPAYPKRWLIYYTPPPVTPGPGPQLPPFEITSSPLSRPANLATYDIDVLKERAGAWSGGHSGSR